jgi:hypothetical protein
MGKSSMKPKGEQSVRASSDAPKIETKPLGDGLVELISRDGTGIHFAILGTSPVENFRKKYS